MASKSDDHSGDDVRESSEEDPESAAGAIDQPRGGDRQVEKAEAVKRPKGEDEEADDEEADDEEADDEEADDEEADDGDGAHGDGEDEAEDEGDTDGDRPRQNAPETGAASSQSAAKRLLEFLKDRYLGADLRWLGVHRICLGILLCVEVLRRMYYARPFYTNDGLLPNHFSLFRPMGRNLFSIYHAFSTYEEVQAAFGVTLVIFLLFTLGYRTRLFNILSAICIISLNNRNIFVENGGTVVVNIMTVYTIFLPSGRRFSVDAVLSSLRRRRDRSALDLNGPDPERGSNRTHTLAMLLFLLQWTAIYFFNVVHKDGVGWTNGTALHWFYWQDRIVTDFGIFMREHAPLTLLKYATWSTLVVEGSLAALILFPFWQTWVRRYILIAVLCLHGLIAASSRIGPFSYVMSLFPLLLLGARDFEVVARWFGRKQRRRIVVFAADAPAIFKVCRLLDRLDPFECLTFVDSRDEAKLPKGYRGKAGLTVVDPNTGKVFERDRALAQALRVLPFGLLYHFWVLLPGLNVVARRALGSPKKRKRFSAWWGDEQEILEPERAARVGPVPVLSSAPLSEDADRFFSGLAQLFVIVLGTAVVFGMLHDNSYVARKFRVQRPEWAVYLIEYPRLLQGWGMFAPEPPYEDGRVVIDGRTKDGRKLDPLTGEEPDFNPETDEGWGHSQFWCDYHNRIRFSGHAPNRQHLRDYVLNQHRYSGRPQDQLVAFDAWWVQDQSPMPGEKKGKPLRPLKLTSHGRVTDSGAQPWLTYPRTRKLEW